jgi:hypothetical protein
VQFAASISAGAGILVAFMSSEMWSAADGGLKLLALLWLTTMLAAVAVVLPSEEQAQAWRDSEYGDAVIKQIVGGQPLARIS